MKRLSIVVLLLISTVFGNFAAGAEFAEVSVLDIRPTQQAAGYASSEASRLFKFKNIKDEAALRNQVMQEKPLRAVFGPGGSVYLTDGHHRALGVFRTSAAICELSRPVAEVDSCLAGIKIKVRIDADYSKSSWDEFLDVLLKENNIYLLPAIRARLASGELTKENIFKGPDRIMPSTLGKLANDPMRSAIATLFYNQGIHGDLYANYVEFLLSERLGGAVKVEVGHEFDPAVQVRLSKVVFGNEDIVKFIRCLARKDEKSWSEAQKEINQAVGVDSAAPFNQALCTTGK